MPYRLCIAIVLLGSFLGAPSAVAQEGQRVVARALHFHGRHSPPRPVQISEAERRQVLLQRTSRSVPSLRSQRPGTLVATADPTHLRVPGLDVTATGLWVYSGSSDYLYVLGDVVAIPGARAHLRVTIDATAGGFYMVICRVQGGSPQYPVHVKNGVMSENVPEASLVPDERGEIVFLIDDAVAGPNVFTLHTALQMAWYGCQVRLLT
jgi:hypothetical protein